jgi:hypothetical protein
MSYSNTPLLDILPYKGYRDNITVSWLTAGQDANYTAVASALEQYHTKFDSTTATSEVLDFLAPLVGLTDQYWNKTWSATVKRNMVNNAHLFWRYLGTKACISAVMTCMGINHTIWQRPGLTIPFPTKRASYPWIEAENILRLYSPVITESKVCYSKFKLGYSKVGDPIL